MEKQLQKMLDKELESQIQNLSKLGSGTKEKSSAVEDVVKLYKMRVEERENENELLNHEKEEQLKSSQLSKDNLFRNIRLGVEIGIFVMQIGFASHWARRGFKFEESGAFTSNTFKSIFNHFKFRNRS